MLIPMRRKMSWVSFAVIAARAFLQLRETRRRIIFYTIVALLSVFVVGNWPLAPWLEEAPLRFLLYWAGCAFLAVFLFLLGLYDFLRIIKEYKEVRGKLQ